MTTSKQWFSVCLSLTLGALLFTFSFILLYSPVLAAGGIIQGKVTYSGGIPGGDSFGTRILVYTQTLPAKSVYSTTLSQAGAYTISGIAPGNYYVYAVIDTNNDTTFSSADALGWYGETTFPTQISVTADTDLIGVDIDVGGPWIPLANQPTGQGTTVYDLSRLPNSGSLGSLFGDTIVGLVNQGIPNQTGLFANINGSWVKDYEFPEQVTTFKVEPNTGIGYALSGETIWRSFFLEDTFTKIFTSGYQLANPTQELLSLKGMALDWANDQTLYVATQWVDLTTFTNQGRLYRSTDLGQTWSQIFTLPVASLAFDLPSLFNVVETNPGATSEIYVAGAETIGGVPYGVIYRSPDSGLTWSQVFSETAGPMAFPNFTTFAVHPLTPTILYAGTEAAGSLPAAVYRSVDSGLSWQQVYTGAGSPLTIGPTGLVYVVSSGNQVVGSQSGAPGDWQALGSLPVQDNILTLLAPSANTVMVGLAANGVYLSADGGTNWMTYNTGLEAIIQPTDLEIAPDDPNKLFAASCNVGSWVSPDAGMSWTKLATLPTCLLDIAIDPGDTNQVLAGGPGSIWHSGDGGLTFTQVYTFATANEGVSKIAVNTGWGYAVGGLLPGGPSNPGVGVVLRTGDQGQNWTIALTETAKTVFKSVAVDSRNNQVAYAGGEDCSASPCTGFLYRTADAGVTWSKIMTTTIPATHYNSAGIESIVIDHQNSNFIYIADASYTIWGSKDSGQSWTQLYQPNLFNHEPFGEVLMMDPRRAGHLYLGGSNYIGESAYDGIWSGKLAPLNSNFITLSAHPSVLAVAYPDSFNQRLYSTPSGIWVYDRQIPWLQKVYLPLINKN